MGNVNWNMCESTISVIYSSSKPPYLIVQELSIAAGDYLYVFGDMDADGFYLTQLVTGESGLVPSNFVEKVADGEGGEEEGGRGERGLKGGKEGEGR